MHYNEKIIIDTIKNYYPIKMEIEYKNLPLKFFAKENKQHFLAVEFFKISELYAIYLFRSDNIENATEFIEDFNNRDIAFQIEDLKTLETILNANSLVG